MKYPIDVDELYSVADVEIIKASETADRATSLMDASIPSEEVYTVALVSLAHAFVAIADVLNEIRKHG